MYAPFSDPDGNGWLLHEIKTRLPGREWEDPTTDISTLAGLLHETAQHHAEVIIYPDSAHGFLFQHHAEFAADVEAFLTGAS